MITIAKLRKTISDKAIIEDHLRNHVRLSKLVQKLDDGDLTVITEIEKLGKRIVIHIEDFDDKDNYQSDYILMLKMLHKTKKILST